METEQQKFTHPEEELAYLREEVRRKERELRESGNLIERERVVDETVRTHAKQDPDAILDNAYQIQDHETTRIIESLLPEAHDSVIKELLATLKEKGVRNTLSVVQKMEKPHITDDFHRALVGYVKEGIPVDGLSEGGALWKSLHMTLYEVMLLRQDDNMQGGFREFVAAMEQFYSGMLSVSGADKKEKQYFTLEIAIANNSDDIIFYVSVPDRKQDLFEKQMQSLFPDIQLTVQENDYNVFVPDGATIASKVSLVKNGIYPIKPYTEFEHDPFNVILNAFSKIEKEGGGASLQLVFNPDTNNLDKKFKDALEDIKKGKPTKEAINIAYSTGGEVIKSVGGVLGELIGTKKTETKDTTEIDTQSAEIITKKLETRIVGANIRMVASATDEARATQILSDIEATFNQFSDPHGNAFKFSRITKGHALSNFVREYSFREYTQGEFIPLSIREVATIVHVPKSGSASSPQFKEGKSSGAPAPGNIPTEGLFLGTNSYRGVDRKIFLSRDDRLRHLYVIGQTGTGKTTFMKNLIAQDIISGDGVCFIDPHGTDIADILGVIPEERFDDVIYFDPGESNDRVLGLNMLEYDESRPQQKTFVVNELFSIFRKLYSEETMGPMFEQYFRNATMLVLEDPSTGSTMMDISRVLSDSNYRSMKLSQCKNPIVKQFWEEIATKAGGEGSLQNMVPYITSKFDVFTANDIMRPIIAQEKSAFDLRTVMDEKKILLVNLSKGKLGDINAHLIGLVLVGKILMAALSRVDNVGDNPPFYLYIDEFQNVTTSSISSILSEARKYNLSLTIAHQFIGQLSEDIRDAVFGNVGSMSVFRVGSDDAGYLEKQFEGVFTARDLINIENRQAYMKMLANGSPSMPFDIAVPAPAKTDVSRIERIKAISTKRYGYPREKLEKYIEMKYSQL